MRGLSESGTRREALRKLLRAGAQSTQEELREKLKSQRFDVTQSTVSRDLRKLGAVKVSDTAGRIVYKLTDSANEPVVAGSLAEMIVDVRANSSIIVIHTPPGSAPLVARHLDRFRPAGILGTIAGDDTIFVAPSSEAGINGTIKAIRLSFQTGSY